MWYITKESYESTEPKPPFPYSSTMAGIWLARFGFGRISDDALAADAVVVDWPDPPAFTTDNIGGIVVLGVASWRLEAPQ